MFQRLMLSVCLLSAVAVVGCQTAAKLPPDVVIQDGKLEGTVKATVNDTAEATRKAMIDIKELTLTMYRVDPTSARVVAIAPNGTRVVVDISRKEDKLSRVMVDTGENGTKGQVMEVFEGIQKYTR